MQCEKVSTNDSKLAKIIIFTQFAIQGNNEAVMRICRRASNSRQYVDEELPSRVLIHGNGRELI